MTNEKINQIFEEIEQAIKESISDKPVPLEQSQFIKKFNEIKEKYT